FLIDEPFSSLDAGLRCALREGVVHSLAHTNAPAIIVTHEQEEALAMADLVAVMRDGECVQVDDPVSLYKRPADMDIARFVGEATILQAPVKDNAVHSLFSWMLHALLARLRFCKHPSKTMQYIVRLGNYP